MSLSKAQRKRLREIARGRSAEGLRLLEGTKAIRDAVAGGHAVEVWADSAAGPEVQAVADAARAAGLPVGAAAPRDLERIGQTVSPQPVIALVRDTAASLEAVVTRPGLLLWLDGLQDPGNVGAVFRVAAAFGVAGVLVGAGSADPLGLKALRASAGLALAVPFARAPAAAIADALTGRAVVALERGGADVRDVGDVPSNLVLVLGGEGRGLGTAARAAATRTVGIPLAPGIDSLNVAVAAGIAVASLVRRATG